MSDEKELPTVYIGKRNLSYYLNVCVKLFDKGLSEILIEGMGQNINKAVDVANFINRLYKKSDVTVRDIKIDIVNKGPVRGLPKYVSRIRILISKET